jgi:hypothetical protein
VEESMTEAEWLACGDPKPMLSFLRGKASDRKSRLFQVACCRRIWNVLPDDDCREAVLVAERYADGAAGDQKRRAAVNRIATHTASADLIAINARYAAIQANKKTVVGKNVYFLGVAAVFGYAARTTGEGDERESYRAAYQTEQQDEAHLVRCIFGNPFRPVILESGWRTFTITNLAQVVDCERQLPEGTLVSDRLAILADALEDASCNDAELLGHLRSPGPHVRGCWALDLLLGKR